MSEVGIIVFLLVQISHLCTKGIRNGGGRLAPFVSMGEAGFALDSVPLNQAVNMPDSAAKFQSGTFFVSVGMINQFLDYFIFDLFVLSKQNLSH